jgi:hypothetical protein
LRPDLPESLEQIVLRMLRSRREDRFGDCEEVAQALDAVIRRSEPGFDLGALVIDCVGTLTRLSRGPQTASGAMYGGDDATVLDAPAFEEDP